MKKILFLFALVLLFSSSTVWANPVYLANPCQTASATTSPSYLLASATSTLNCEVIDYRNSQKGESAIVLIQSIASTSASIQTIQTEYSLDGIDWFGGVKTTASTTNSIVLDNVSTFTVKGSDTSSTTRRAFFIDTPTSWVRLIIVATTGNSSIWAKIIPFKQGK